MNVVRLMASWAIQILEKRTDHLSLMLVAAMIGTAGLVSAPIAHADETVTYEIVSEDVSVANVEYFDRSERRALRTPLPWRIDVTVVNPRSPSIDGAQVRADWRAEAKPARWVTVRIYLHGTVICQSTLDVGNATCYGSTPHIS